MAMNEHGCEYEWPNNNNNNNNKSNNNNINNESLGQVESLNIFRF